MQWSSVSTVIYTGPVHPSTVTLSRCHVTQEIILFYFGNVGWIHLDTLLSDLLIRLNKFDKQNTQISNSECGTDVV